MHDRVCIVGAGSSGIVAAKVLLQRGIPFDCYELGSDIGGLWRYNNDNGMSAAYRSLHINSSRHEMAFSDYPMPRSYPDFPHHTQILRYFEGYVEHFGIRDHVTFQTRVEKVAPTDSGYLVSVSDSNGTKTLPYGSVIVCNGHHWCPRHVQFPGHFDGLSMHSHDYKTPDKLVDKRVLVIGIGNSGCDIACESSRVSAKTLLSTRRGAHIIPKYIFGKPLDHVCPAVIWNWLPFSVFQRLFGLALYVTRGRLSRYGLPTPRHKILEEHPTVSSELLNLVGHGRIHVRPNVERFDGHTVRFEDGSAEDVDVVIHATGYQIKFPFLDSSVMNPEGNQVPLFRRVVHPTLPGLYFVGLVQPWGPLMPLSEAQSEWIADLLEGKASLPSAEKMEKLIARERRKMSHRYIDSVRHTIQVDFHPYLAELRRARKYGKRNVRTCRPPASTADTSMDSHHRGRRTAA